MTNTTKVIFLIATCLIFTFSGMATFAYQNPIINAGPDLNTTPGQTIVLQASAYDPNGFLLSYSWSCTSGTLSSYNILQPTYTAPVNSYNYQQTSYTCTVTATNVYGNSATDSVIINVNYNNSNNVQTVYPSYISDYQATLNATVSNINYSSTNYIYFQWGTTTNYGTETQKQTAYSAGSFTQNIYNLTPNTAYHFRAVFQSDAGTIYGQDMSFRTTGSALYTNNGLTVDKKVINITSGNKNWSSSVNASPFDILSFSIIIQASGQDAHNVTIKDILSSNLIYKGNLLLGTSSYAGDVTSGLNIGTVYVGQPVIISYQVQVASADNFSYGVNTIGSNTTITSTENNTQNSLAAVVVNKSLVYGATMVATGLTNNIITDSFFLPLLLIILMAWFYFSGIIYKFTGWIKNKI